MSSIGSNSNYSFVSAKQLDVLGTKIMIADGQYNPSGTAGMIYGPNADIVNKYSHVYFRHNKQANVLFTDGHIASGNWNQIYGQGVFDKVNGFPWAYDSVNF